MNWPPLPGPGAYALTLYTPAFYVLTAVMALFILMLAYLLRSHPRAQRALDGYLEAASVDIVFLAFSLALVLGLAWHDPYGNRTAFALYSVILRGYWLALAIPVVTVGSSVHNRSRGSIPWLGPSVAIAAILFGIFFAVYFSGL